MLTLKDYLIIFSFYFSIILSIVVSNFEVVPPLVLILFRVSQLFVTLMVIAFIFSCYFIRRNLWYIKDSKHMEKWRAKWKKHISSKIQANIGYFAVFCHVIFSKEFIFSGILIISSIVSYYTHSMLQPLMEKDDPI